MKFSRRRTIAALAAVSAAGVGGFAARAALARYYDGPVSDHVGGTHFSDPHGTPRKGGLATLRWSSGAAKTQWPTWAPSPFVDRPPARVASSRWRISYVGHASLLIQTAGLNLLIDPVWSERASPFTFAGPKRVNDPAVAFEALPEIDAVLVSHNHYDHLDVATLARLADAHRPRVVTPLGNDTILRAHDAAIAAESYEWHQRVVLGEGVAVNLVPVRHWSARGLFDRNRALWAGFVIETPAGRIFHVADSGYGEGRHFRVARERYGPFRLAVLPVGAYEPRSFMGPQHMNPAEAVKAFADSGAELALGHHYATFQLTDEGIHAPVAALVAARAAAGLSSERFRLLRPGEVWEL